MASSQSLATNLLGVDSRLLEVVEYRKSGLSLNHIVGCPLDCAYCVRHLFSNFDMKQPRLLMSDEDGFKALTEHRFFQPHVTPVQILNRATDPFLATVKPHTFAVAEMLDAAGFRNHLLLITRFKVTPEDCDRLNQIKNLRVTLLITYSGIDDNRIEPVDSKIAAESLEVAFSRAEAYRTILYWRPIVPGLNDSAEHMARAIQLSRHAHATVFTGLFYREEMKQFFDREGLPQLSASVARRKIMPREAELRILRTFAEAGGAGTLFRKTSCGVAFAHRTHDYNGHYGIRELCDICPSKQLDRCRTAWKRPETDQVVEMAERLGATALPTIDDRCVQIEGLDEQRRYYIQHSLGYQVHDVKYPHHRLRHGRAEIGWAASDTELTGNIVQS